MLIKLNRMYKPAKPVRNIIVGAGPAGVQLAYFFKKAGIDYVILERNQMAGSFFDRYPHTGQLISINKRHTGSDNDDFKLRHDWNSLLSDDGPKFTDYSKDYYPDSKDLVRYINDFAKKYELNIKYNSRVEKIRKFEKGGYVLAVEEGDKKWVYRCERLIIATGMGVPDMGGLIDNSKRKCKHYAEFEKDYFKKPENLKKYENKNVLIIGNGNSGFELANHLTPYAAKIDVMGNRPKKWASVTHYAGDLRSIYMPFFDTFLLKSLNAFDTYPYNIQKVISQDTETSPYTLSQKCSSETCTEKHNVYPVTFDEVILCTGWKFDESIFDFEVPLFGKYPLITPKFESTDSPGLFFIGSLMHGPDHKKSSGGFIHGFRYLIQHFFHINYDGKLDIVKFNSNSVPALVNHIIYRINNSSAIYQMYGQLADIFIWDPVKKDIVYMNGVHREFIQSESKDTTLTYFVLTLEFSDDQVTDVYKIGERTTHVGTESNSKLLHPILRVLKKNQDGRYEKIDIVHFDEDLFADFTDKKRYADKLTRTLRMFIN
jgi:thioredoxin reductase